MAVLSKTSNVAAIAIMACALVAVQAAPVMEILGSADGSSVSCEGTTSIDYSKFANVSTDLGIQLLEPRKGSPSFVPVVSKGDEVVKSTTVDLRSQDPSACTSGLQAAKLTHVQIYERKTEDYYYALSTESSKDAYLTTVAACIPGGEIDAEDTIEAEYSDSVQVLLAKDPTPAAVSKRIRSDVSALNLPATQGHSTGSDCSNDDNRRERRGIVDTDDRVEVNSTYIGQTPWKMAVCITYNNVDGTSPTYPVCACSGVLIGPRHILTSGHCVHEGNGGALLDIYRLYYAPLNGNEIDNSNVYYSGVKKVHVPSGWADNSDMEYDYAMIRSMKDNGGQHAGDRNGYMAFGYDSNIDSSYFYNTFGYPLDASTARTGNWMRHSGDNAIDVYQRYITHKADTWSGMSGSPLYLLNGSTRIIHAIHSGWSGWANETQGDTSFNTATKINNYRYGQICGWIEQTGHYVC